MTMEPINLFAGVTDHAGVARRLRELAPAVKIEGPDHDWRSARIDFGRSGTLTLNYDPDYHAEPHWSTQMKGMQGYLSRFPETGRKPRAMLLPTTFRYALGVQLDPDSAAGGDPRLDLLFTLAGALDAVLFTPSALRDAHGRILVSAAGAADEDPAAVFPREAAEVPVPSQPGAAFGGGPPPAETDDDEDDDEDEDDPPSAERVARRALALAAVTARAFLERDVPQGALGKLGALLGMNRPGAGGQLEARYRELLRWVDEIGIDDELEEHESELLRQPLGKVDRRSQVGAEWQLEGLAVLAWALGRFEFPAHDEPANPQALWDSLGLLRADTARALLANPTLRPREEMKVLRDRLFAIHWRLRDFSLRPNVMDFAGFARTAWFGPLDLTGLTLVEGDLGVRGMRLDRVPPDIASMVVSAALGRHQAANWLWEGPDDYYEADAST